MASERDVFIKLEKLSAMNNSRQAIVIVTEDSIIEVFKYTVNNKSYVGEKFCGLLDFIIM